MKRQVHRRSLLDDARATAALERAILDLDEEGFQTPSIARRLGVDAHTVSRVLRKFRPDFALSSAAAQAGCDQLLRAHLRAGQHDLPSPIAAALVVALGVQPMVARRG